MRGVCVLVLWLLATGVAMARTDHVRGDFRFSTGPVPDFVERREVAPQWDPQAPGADNARWRFWLYDRQSDRRGSDAVFTDYVYEARSASLLGDAGKFQIDFNPAYQRLTIHEVALRRDGAWSDRLVPDRISLARRESGFERDLADGLVAALVVLDDVRIDDVVRIAYTVEGSNPILAGDVYDSVALAWGNPMLDVSMRVLYPPGSAPLVLAHRTERVPVVAAVDGAVAVTVAAHGAAAVVDEGDYPGWYRRHPRVSVAPRRAWADVVAWALPLYPAEQPLPADLEARIGEWRGIRDPGARLGAALRAVQDEVRYFGVEMGDNTHRPAAPADTWARRYGDCKDKSYLLATILARLGIPAVPALVSNGSGRAIAEDPPSASVFDHVIVRARLGPAIVWVDPTATLEGGDPRSSDQSAYGLALPVAAGTTALERIEAPATASRALHVVERLVADADGRAVRMEIETTYRGAAADATRRNFASERPDERARRYAEFYRKRFGELRAEHEPEVSDDRGGNVLVVRERYALVSPFEPGTGATRVLDLYADAVDAPTVLPRTLSRSGPLRGYPRGVYVHESEFSSPADWRPRFSSERSSATSAGLEYQRKVESKAGAVSVVHRVALSRDDLDPAELPGHLAELRKVRDELSSRLRFDVPAGLAGASRQQRLEALLKGVLEEGDRP